MVEMGNNVYLLEWYGPFRSVEEVLEWEAENMGRDKTYLYLIRGKKKGARNYSFYCGQAWKQTAGERMTNKNHHIKEVDGRPEHLTIWVAMFQNIKPKKQDVNLAEKLLTSVMAQVEIADEKTVLNQTNKLRPRVTIHMINEWYYPSGDPVYQFRKNTMCNIIHDLLICYPQDGYASIYGNKKIHWIKDIK